MPASLARRAEPCHPRRVVRNQLGLQKPPRALGLEAQLSMLAPAMREAVLAAFDAYAALGIPFALVGGLAAAAHGRPHFTKSVDFLVGDEAFVRTGLIVSFAKPMPLQAGEVAIDPIPLPEDAHRKARLAEALRAPLIDRSTGRDLPILAPTWVAHMKLASPRGKDRDDIVGMLRAGTSDLDQLREAVRGDDELAGRLDAALGEAALEDA
jgi:hypothetical protein